jgi:hypothetical protein
MILRSIFVPNGALVSAMLGEAVNLCPLPRAMPEAQDFHAFSVAYAFGSQNSEFEVVSCQVECKVSSLMSTLIPTRQWARN